jgi:hypothetical protein
VANEFAYDEIGGKRLTAHGGIACSDDGFIFDGTDDYLQLDSFELGGAPMSFEVRLSDLLVGYCLMAVGCANDVFFLPRNTLAHSLPIQSTPFSFTQYSLFILPPSLLFIFLIALLLHCFMCKGLF